MASARSFNSISRWQISVDCSTGIDIDNKKSCTFWRKCDIVIVFAPPLVDLFDVGCCIEIPMRCYWFLPIYFYRENFYAARGIVSRRLVKFRYFLQGDPFCVIDTLPPKESQCNLTM